MISLNKLLILASFLCAFEGITPALAMVAHMDSGQDPVSAKLVCYQEELTQEVARLQRIQAEWQATLEIFQANFARMRAADPFVCMEQVLRDYHARLATASSLVILAMDGVGQALSGVMDETYRNWEFDGVVRLANINRLEAELEALSADLIQRQRALMQLCIDIELWRAIGQQNVPRVGEMLYQRANPNFCGGSNSSKTPLFYAIELSSRDSFYLLGMRGANINAKFEPVAGSSLSVLHYAVLNDRLHMVELLATAPLLEINHQVVVLPHSDKSELFESGDTAAHMAVRQGREDLLRMLLGHKNSVGRYDADLNIKNAKGFTPIDLAIKTGRMDLIRVFEAWEHCCVVETKIAWDLVNAEGWSPRQFLDFAQSPACVFFLQQMLVMQQYAQRAGVVSSSSREHHEVLPHAAHTLAVVNEDHKCAICQEDDEVDDEDIQTQIALGIFPTCGHIFHTACLVGLVQADRAVVPRCPMCRSESLGAIKSFVDAQEAARVRLPAVAVRLSGPIAVPECVTQLVQRAGPETETSSAAAAKPASMTALMPIAEHQPLWRSVFRCFRGVAMAVVRGAGTTINRISGVFGV